MSEVANVIELQIVFDRARSRVYMERIAGHARRTLQADLNERMPRKLPSVLVSRVYDEEDDE
jgi:hypothetical protein